MKPRTTTDLRRTGFAALRHARDMQLRTIEAMYVAAVTDDPAHAERSERCNRSRRRAERVAVTCEMLIEQMTTTGGAR